jgi:hypothetical protein
MCQPRSCIYSGLQARSADLNGFMLQQHTSMQRLTMRGQLKLSWYSEWAVHAGTLIWQQKPHDSPSKQDTSAGCAGIVANYSCTPTTAVLLQRACRAATAAHAEKNVQPALTGASADRQMLRMRGWLDFAATEATATHDHNNKTFNHKYIVSAMCSSSREPTAQHNVVCIP